MKGTLHKTGSGWQVWYHAKGELYHSSIRVKILPILDHGYVNGPGLSDSDDGKEVEFEIVANEGEPLGRGEQPYKQYAKLVDKATRPLTEDDALPKYPEVKIVCPRCKALMPCECNPTRKTSLLDSVRANPSWDTIIREFHIATQQFHIATQQVPKGAPPLIFECWLVDNYNPPTKKQDNE